MGEGTKSFTLTEMFVSNDDLGFPNNLKVQEHIPLALIHKTHTVFITTSEWVERVKFLRLFTRTLDSYYLLGELTG